MRPIEVENWEDYWVEILTIPGNSWTFKKGYFNKGTSIRIRVEEEIPLGGHAYGVWLYFLDEANYHKYVNKTSFEPELVRYGSHITTSIEVPRNGTFYFVLENREYTRKYEVDIKLDGTRHGTHIEYREVAQYLPIYSLGLVMLASSFPMLLIGLMISAKPSIEINPWLLLFCLFGYGIVLLIFGILDSIFRSLYPHTVLYSDISLFSIGSIVALQSIITFRIQKTKTPLVPLPLPKVKPKVAPRRRATKKKRTKPSGKTEIYSKSSLGLSKSSFKLPSGEIRCGNCGVVNSPNAKYCRNCGNSL